MTDTINAEVVIPEWTNWIAVDKCGQVYAYEHKPILGSYHDSWMNTTGHNTELLYDGVPPKDYKQELYTYA